MILFRQVFRGYIACYGPITLLQRHPQISTTTLSSSSSSSSTPPARTTTTTAGPPFLFLTSGDPVRARTIPIDDANGGWNITIYEVDQLAAIVESYWDNAFIDGNDNDARRTATNKKKKKTKKQDDVVVVRPSLQLDPFGLVAWPGAVVAARELQEHASYRVVGKNVLVLGAGCGVEALAAAALGAASVLATDIHEQTLELLTLAAAATAAKKSSSSPWYDDIRPTTTIATKLFDITDHAIPLPDIDNVDLMIIADVLYNDELAHYIAVRIEELLSYTRLHRRRSGRHNNNKNVRILVTDSQRFVANDTLFPVDRWGAKWETRQLVSFCGSGVALNEDQIYNVTARVLWITGGDGDDDNGAMTEDTTAPTTPTTDS
jgi:predicted nicotinamide N-methyase